MADLEDLLVKTSRTFALSIPLLPEPTRAEVTLAYLLFRIADTFEDAFHWSREDRIAALEEFDRLLAAEDAEASRAAVARWLELGPSEHEGYVELIGEVPAVLAAYFELSPAARRSITEHTQRTCRGMAEFVGRTDDRGSLQLTDLDDLKHYCYIVAGIVGEMLTELFLDDRPQLLPVADALKQRARAFGEALQLVNILKDSADDALEGRCFLPPAVSREEVFAVARDDLNAATEYVNALQSAAPDGIVAFTALPVLLALATLDRVEESGPGAKLSRPEVATIVQAMNEAISEKRQVISN